MRAAGRAAMKMAVDGRAAGAGLPALMAVFANNSYRPSLSSPRAVSSRGEHSPFILEQGG